MFVAGESQEGERRGKMVERNWLGGKRAEVKPGQAGEERKTSYDRHWIPAPDRELVESGSDDFEECRRSISRIIHAIVKELLLQPREAIEIHLRRL